MEELTKQLTKLPQQLKEMHGTTSKLQQIAYYDICIADNPTRFCPPINEEVNYMGNQQQRPTPYQRNQSYQHEDNANYGLG